MGKKIGYGFLTVLFALMALMGIIAIIGNGRADAFDIIFVGIFALCALLFAGKMRRSPPKNKKAAPPATVVQRGHDINVVLPAEAGEAAVEVPLVSIEYRHIDPDEDMPAPPGAALTYLDARALKFWNKKHTDYIIPPYYQDTAFGRNVGPALKRLLDGGYLDIGGIDKSIGLKTVPELKAILADRELKVSGNKPELIQRLIANVPPDELEALFPVSVYCITEKGERALGPYTVVDANDAHALGFSYYRLMQERAANTDEGDEDLLLRLLDEDIDRSLHAGERGQYQEFVLRKGRFLHELGADVIAFESYALNYFMWALDARTLGICDHGQHYHQARHLEQCGKLCGYSLDEVKARMRDVITEINPFGLATGYNVKYVLGQFVSALGIK